MQAASGPGSHRKSLLSIGQRPDQDIAKLDFGGVIRIERRKANEYARIVGVASLRRVEREPIHFEREVPEDFARIPQQTKSTLGLQNSPKQTKKAASTRHRPARETSREERLECGARWLHVPPHAGAGRLPSKRHA